MPQIVMDTNHVMGYVDRVTEGPNLLHQPVHIQVDEKTVISSDRPGHSQ
jgi:hypothetical protein